MLTIKIEASAHNADDLSFLLENIAEEVSRGTISSKRETEAGNYSFNRSGADEDDDR